MRKWLWVTGLALVVAVPLLATDGPLTNLMNLRVRTNENGYLIVSGGAAGAVDGPLTAMANVRGRTDENGYLRVSLASGSILTSPSVTGVLTETNAGLATTSTDGLVVRNTTAATAGATVQISPRIRQSGTAWDADDAVSRTVSWIDEVLPVSGNTVSSIRKWGVIDPVTGVVTYPMTVAPVGSLSVDGVNALMAINSTASGLPSFQFQDGGVYKTGFYWNRATNRVHLDDGGIGAIFGGNVTFPADITVVGADAQSLAFKQLSELTTIAAAATTDTTIQMPANAIVLAVSVRVTTVIPTATTFTVGDSGSAARFSTAAVSVAATSTDPGTKAGAYYNASALSIRITPNGTPADNTGRVRVTIYYLLLTPPTS